MFTGQISASLIALAPILALGVFGCSFEPQECLPCHTDSREPLMGPTGPRGPAGASAAPLTGYMAKGQADALPGAIGHAEAFCEEGDLMTGGLCQGTQGVFTAAAPLETDDGEPFGLHCAGSVLNPDGTANVASGMVFAFVFCVER